VSDQASTELDKLSILGHPTRPSKKLEAFPNRSPGRYYLVTLETEEFTCLCPVTGQPDFAKINIQYVPDENIVESKSLKLYLWSYRDEGAFHEHVVNHILDDLVAVLNLFLNKAPAPVNTPVPIRITVRSEYIKTPEARKQWSDQP
jgi:7-cyano-7-deazaguanine reductase